VQRAEEWQAIVTVVVSPPDTELTILKNPLGIYVVEFAWSQREKLGGDA
jgi:type IV secretory pathway TrbF-like protein